MMDTPEQNYDVSLMVDSTAIADEDKGVCARYF